MTLLVSELANKLKPYILDWISSSGGGEGPYAPSPHALDGVHHVGTLATSQYADALLRDGSRSLTGNLSVGAGITIDGVDLSAHVADVNAHHAQQHTLTGGDHTAAGLTAGQVVRASGETTFAWAQLQHSDLGGVVADQHIAHSGVTLTAGNGLTGGGTIAASRTFAVGAGDGIDVAADSVAVDVTDFIDTAYGLTESSNNIRVNLASPSGLSFATGALQLDDSVAGAGLTIASKVLAVGAGDGIDVAADSVAVDVTDIIGSGLTESSNNINLDWGTPTIGTIQPDATANAGTSTNPARSDHQHAIVCAAPAANSVSLAASAEGTGTSFARADHTHSLSQAIVPTWTGAHTHNSTITINTANELRFRDSALRVYSSVDGQLDIDADVEVEITAPTVTIVSSTRTYIQGALDVDGDLEFQGSQVIKSTASGQITLQPAGSLLIDPDDAQAKVADDVTLKSVSYASQTTGWGISGTGSADFRYLFTDELHAKTFIADLEQALAGGQIISKSVAVLSRTFTAPAAGGATTLYVWDLPSAENMAVFQSGDIILLRSFSRAGGSLSITNCWGVVTGYSNLSGKEQSWTFTRSTGGNAGAITAGATVAADAIVLDFGTTGNGYYEVNAIDGAYAENSPYMQIVTWASHPATGKTVRLRSGNLKGITSVAEYGLFAGDGLTDADKYLRLSDQNIEIHNVPVKMYDGANVAILLEATTPSLAIGSTYPTAFDTGDGIWMGKDTSYKFRVGDVDGERLEWDGSALKIYDGNGTEVLQADDNGVWLSTLAISQDLGAFLFSQADGLLLLGPGCAITPTSWTSTRGQVATLSGAFHQVAGRWPETRALLVEVGTTNLCTNPSAETGISGWLAYGTNTIAQSSDVAFVGDYSVKVTYQDNATLCRANTPSLSASTTYAASAWVFVPDDWDGGDIYINFESYSGASVTERVDVTVTGQWKRCYAICTLGAGTGGFVRIKTTAAPTAGKYIYVDAVQYEQANAPTGYVDGSLAWGEWSSTPHASTSTRTTTSLSIPNPEALGGNSTYSISLWLQMPHASDGAWTDNEILNRVFFIYDSASADYFYLTWRVTTQKWRIYNSATVQAVEISDTFAAGDWKQIVVVYDSTTIHFYANGTLLGSGTLGATLAAVTAVTLGGTSGGNFVYGEIAIFDRVLTADEVAAIYASGKPLADAGSLETPGIYILDGKFRLASSSSGVRTELLPAGLGVYNGAGTTGVGRVLTGIVDTTNKVLDESSSDLGMFGYDASDDLQVAWYASGSNAGKIVAGGGALFLDDDGLNITVSSSYEDKRAIKYYDGTTLIGDIFCRALTSPITLNYMLMQMERVAGTDATIRIVADVVDGTGQTSSVSLWAAKDGAPSGAFGINSDSEATLVADLLINGYGLTVNYGVSIGKDAFDYAPLGHLRIYNATSAPAASITDGIILYAQDVSLSSELKVRDEAGNITVLSPHNFSLCGGPSEPMAWAYYSERGGKAINVDMLKLARYVEMLTGDKLVYIAEVK